MTGPEFREIRKRLGYSLRELSKKIGADRRVLSAAEKQKGAVKQTLALSIRQIEQEET